MGVSKKYIRLGNDNFIFDDVFDEMILDLSQTKEEIFIYGAGIGAKKVRKILEDHKIKIDGYIIDKEYMPIDNMVDGKAIVAIESLTEEKCNIVVGFLGAEREQIERLASLNNVVSVYAFDFVGKYVIGEDSQMSQRFLNENSAFLSELYERLEDAESRKHFIDFINQKAGCSYWKNKSEKIQYFDDDVIVLGENEIFIDCGAYDGDTILEFIKCLKNKKIKSFKTIYAFESDQVNLKKMHDNLSDFENINIIPQGVFDKKTILHFSETGTMSSQISETGTEIAVTTIDEVLNGDNVTFIKMDIEGSEYNALIGASKTISKYKPKMAICVYHKKDDIIRIPQLLLKLNPDYKFKLRNYCVEGIETVLYAI